MVTKLNIELAKALLEEAKLDLESAKTHIQYKRWHKAVFDAQQCAEKAMKAALACEGITYISDHDPSGFFAVDVVMRAPESWVESLREVLHETAWLMDQYSVARYARIRARRVVTPLKLYKKEDAEEAVRIAEKTLFTIEKFLKEVYFKNV